MCMQCSTTCLRDVRGGEGTVDVLVFRDQLVKEGDARKQQLKAGALPCVQSACISVAQVVFINEEMQSKRSVRDGILGNVSDSSV